MRSSSYPGTCIRAARRGNEPYVPVQVGGTYAGQKGYCTPDTDGVSYNDFTPRWGAAWDIFGTGKTSVKWNMGKYLSGAGISGIYADANPAARTVNEYFRTWTDVDGDRSVDCDLLNFNAQESARAGTSAAGRHRSSLPGQPCGTDATRSAWMRQARRSVWPRPSADATEAGIPAAVQAYCDAYGDNLLDGWGKRRSEWQFGLGIQHELLPRLSAEVTYNRRSYSNLTVTDQLGIGCDRFNGAQDHAGVQGRLPELHLRRTTASSASWRQAILCLPGGGGYVIRGLTNPNASLRSVSPGRGDDHGRAGLHMERRRHQLRVARHRQVGPSRPARQRRHQHGSFGA